MHTVSAIRRIVRQARIGWASYGLAVLVLGGCNLLVGPSPSLNPKPTSGPIPLAVAEATVSPLDCPDTPLVGVLVTDTDTGFGVATDDGWHVRIVWPPGYSAAPAIGGGILFDPAGAIVAHTTERVRIAGVVPGDGGRLRACGPIILLATF